MGGRAGGGASGGMGSKSRSGGARQNNFYTFDAGNGQTVTISKNKTPADVVKQGNRLVKQLGERLKSIPGYDSVKSFSDLAAVKNEANRLKGQSAQRIKNALKVAKAMTKGSRGGYGMTRTK